MTLAASPSSRPSTLITRRAFSSLPALLTAGNGMNRQP